MRQQDVLKQLTTPVGAPACPRGPCRFTHRKDLNILYRTDITVEGAWTGPARLQLFEPALAPLAGIPAREIVSDSHLLTDQTLARARRCLDYLDNTR